MATRLRHAAVRRPSLPLSSEDEAALRVVRESDAQLQALAELLDLDIDLRSATESALLQAIFRVGLRLVTESALLEGYEELARQLEPETAERRAFARRRQPTWAAEQ